eukprot:TRINITY_DN11035_c0_g1_i2.p1 TRINITY_DN11035_c0_g1~~TRINITY_DN11035_c0_g1_i2.p1  ORF type:complete len:166 (+),score=32.03 TRINITY_DN11035_c0_g1_i2:83-580(+)
MVSRQQFSILLRTSTSENNQRNMYDESKENEADLSMKRYFLKDLSKSIPTLFVISDKPYLLHQFTYLTAYNADRWTNFFITEILPPPITDEIPGFFNLGMKVNSDTTLVRRDRFINFSITLRTDRGNEFKLEATSQKKDFFVGSNESNTIAVSYTHLTLPTIYSV